MHNKRSCGAGPAVLAFVLMSALGAQAAEREGADRGADEQDSSRWGIGAGVAFKRSLYAGVGNKNSGLPLISYENKWVRAFGNQLDVKLPSYGPFDFSLRSQVAIGEGYEASDSVQLQGMAERKRSIYLGAAATWRNPVADVSLVWLRDASNHSKGSVLKLGAEHSLRLGQRLELVPHAEWARYDDKYVDYYYGVRPGEATANRAAYRGEAASTLQLGLRLQYGLAPRQRLFLDVSGRRFSSGITDSPIVERRSEPALRMGYLYAF